MPRNIHDFMRFGTGTTYDLTQTDDSIKDGDLFVCQDYGKPVTIGFLDKAWPVRLFGPRGKLDGIAPEWNERFFAERPGLHEDAKQLIEDLGLATDWKYESLVETPDEAAEEEARVFGIGGSGG